ncbi:ATP synthase E chain-domain-containing protein [Xylariaceae sp. FL0016]|nr:ATP synthase E chain-domain-containing protein [Xylariaceae sp. FL0016]
MRNFPTFNNPPIPRIHDTFPTVSSLHPTIAFLSEGQLAFPLRIATPTHPRDLSLVRNIIGPMSASGVNVLRYSALAFGVFYGFTHQRSITASQKAAAAQKDYEHKQHLIEQARAEYSKSKNPQPASSDKSPLDQDMNSASFDLEAYMNAFASAKA